MEHFRSPEAETDPGDAESGNVFLFLTRFFTTVSFFFCTLLGCGLLETWSAR